MFTGISDEEINAAQDAVRSRRKAFTFSLALPEEAEAVSEEVVVAEEPVAVEELPPITPSATEYYDSASGASSGNEATAAGVVGFELAKNTVDVEEYATEAHPTASPSHSAEETHDTHKSLARAVTGDLLSNAFVEDSIDCKTDAAEPEKPAFDAEGVTAFKAAETEQA